MESNKKTPLLCRLGWHRWSPWQFAEHVSIPRRVTQLETRELVHHGIQGDLYDRYCERCGKDEDHITRITRSES